MRQLYHFVSKRLYQSHVADLRLSHPHKAELNALDQVFCIRTLSIYMGRLFGRLKAASGLQQENPYGPHGSTVEPLVVEEVCLAASDVEVNLRRHRTYNGQMRML